MNKTDQQLEREIIDLQNKITSAGKYMAAVAEGITDESSTIVFDSGNVATDPVEKANDIIEVAHDIKKMAIQYQALAKLEDNVFGQNKKAINNLQDSTQEVAND